MDDISSSEDDPFQTPNRGSICPILANISRPSYAGPEFNHILGNSPPRLALERGPFLRPMSRTGFTRVYTLSKMCVDVRRAFVLARVRPGVPGKMEK